jgi:hypoxanthine-DNA glycosylase
MIFSFSPIINKNAQVLILGTMPGKESLRAGEYYAHPRNAFWKIMFELAGEDFSDNYAIRKRLLLNNNIALWDVLESCERVSSLDSDIRDELPNDIISLLKKYPQIRTIFFNGQHAAKLFKKYNPEIALVKYILPSTSPAHAVPFSRKAEQWHIIFEVSKV